MKKSKWSLQEPLYVKKEDPRYNEFKEVLDKTGVSPDESWSLCTTISEFTIPRLKRYRDDNCVIPSFIYVMLGVDGSYFDSSVKFSKKYREKIEKKAEKLWYKVLDQMIEAHELVIRDDGSWSWTKKEEKKVKKGLKLFHRYYLALWW